VKSTLKYDWLAELPDTLAAHQQISIPYRLTALTSLDQSGENTGGGCQSYSQTSTASYSYDCANGSTSSGSTSSTFHSSCPSNGGASGPRSEDYYYSSGGGAYGGGKGGYGGGSPNYSSLGEGGGCQPTPDRNNNSCNDETADQNQPVGSSISLSQMEFNDHIVDLRVKVPGGFIDISRQFYDRIWHWHPIDSHLNFIYKSLSQSSGSIGVARRGVRDSGFVSQPRLSSSVLVGIRKEGITYRPSKTTTAQGYFVYIKDQAKIIQSENGYRWQNKAGFWAEYNSKGRLLAFGNRLSTLGKVLYQDNDSNLLMIGFADRLDRQVIWIERDDGKIIVRDASNRRVEYHLTRNELSRSENLTKVIDVLGQETLYEYEERLLNVDLSKWSGGGKKGSARRATTRSSGAVVVQPNVITPVSLMVSKQTPSGGITHIEYNNSGRPSHVIDVLGNEYVFEYEYTSGKREYYRRMTTPSEMVKEIWLDEEGKTRLQSVIQITPKFRLNMNTATIAQFV